MKNRNILIFVTVLSLSGLVFATSLAQTSTLLPTLSTDKILTIDPALLTIPVTTVAPATSTTRTPTVDTTTSTPPIDSTTPTTGIPTGAVIDGTVVTGTTDTTVIPDRTTTVTNPVSTTTGQTTGTVAPAGTTGGRNSNLIPPGTTEPPVQEVCPPINPLSPEKVECPRTEQVPVIPQVPYLLVATPLLGALLFMLIFSVLNRRQGKQENQLQQRLLSADHQKTVSASRNSLYLDLLNHVSGQLGSAQGMDEASLQKFSSRIELLGSKEVQAINQKLSLAFDGKNRQQIKGLLKDLALQIRKEL